MNGALSVCSEFLQLILSLWLQALIYLQSRDSFGADNQVFVVFEDNLSDLEWQVKVNILLSFRSVVLCEGHVPLGKLWIVYPAWVFVRLDHRYALFVDIRTAVDCD